MIFGQAVVTSQKVDGSSGRHVQPSKPAAAAATVSQPSDMPHKRAVREAGL